MSAVRTRTRTARTSRSLITLAGVVGLIAALALASSAPPPAGAAKSKPTVVLVHGAWADASSWNAVIARLQDDGYRVIAPANPLRSLKSDSAYVASILGQEHGPFVVVGHSYGGAVITNAADGNPNVKALVFVDAFVPDVGEDILHLAGEGSMIPDSIEFKQFPPGGEGDLDAYLKVDKLRETFAADLPESQTAVMAVTQRPLALAAATGPSEAAAWKTIPSWYLLGRQDRAITPAAQRFMAKRAHSTIVAIDSSHVSLISHPGAVTRLIERAARDSS